MRRIAATGPSLQIATAGVALPPLAVVEFLTATFLKILDLRIVTSHACSAA